MKCLVTGGAGFIGSNLALELEKQGHSVVVIDNLQTGNLKNLEGFQGEFIKGDVSKPMKISKVDVIFHEAAITDPRHPDDNETYEKNINGFKEMIKLAQKINAKLIYASTASLYGNGKVPMQEDQKKEILSVYGKSKWEMDQMAQKLYSKMHIVGLRYFNVFGPREKFKNRAASMVYHLGKQMKQGGKPRLFKFGEQIRDHIYVKDVVDATIKGLDAPSGVYNVGSGIGTSFNDLVLTINAVLKKKLEQEYFDMPYDPKTYQANTHADTTRAQMKLRFKSQWSLKEGIADYFKFLDRMKWYNELD